MEIPYNDIPGVNLISDISLKKNENGGSAHCGNGKLNYPDGKQSCSFIKRLCTSYPVVVNWFYL